MWYDVNKTLSHNCLLNFVVGPRGVGKTYACKKRMIKRFIDKGEQFVYMRRYDTELKKSMMENFFDDVSREFEGHEFKYDSGKFYIDKMEAGYAIPLSRAAQYKSVPFPEVGFILFDEFIIDQGMIRYLPNEVHTFQEMYSTIARLRDVIVVFAANAITFTNPYFIYFGLKLQKGQKIAKKNDILLEWVDSPTYTEAASQTRFGKIIQGTDYGRYAMANEFLRDTDVFIEKIPEAASPLFTLIIDSQSFGVHSVRGSNILYVSESVDETLPIKIALNKESHNTDTLARQGIDATIMWNRLQDSYFRGEVRFTSITAKNLVTQFMKG